MPDESERTPNAETVHLTARELLRLDLTDKEAQALRPLLEALLGEVGRFRPARRNTRAPGVGLTPKVWAP